MKVHIVPHGRATIHVKRGLRDYASVDKVYLLTSDAFEQEGVELEQELAEFGYEDRIQLFVEYKAFIVGIWLSH